MILQYVWDSTLCAARSPHLRRGINLSALASHIRPATRTFHGLPPAASSTRTLLSSRPAHLPTPHTQSFNVSALGLRSLSFNLFNRQPTPSPAALVHLTRLEADANVHPESIPKQLALWSELIQYPAGARRVLARYERLLEFDKHSPLVRSPELFEMYIKALLATNQAGAIDAAVRTRDAVLALPIPEPAEAEVAEKELTASQRIARDVVGANNAAATTKSQENWVSSLRGRILPGATGAFAAARGSAEESGGASGARTNPVHVIVEEPRGNVFFKAVRFVFLTGLALFVILTVISIVLENSGLTRAASQPKNMEFEPSTTGKIYKFSDVHGVDEAKEELMEIVQFLKDPTSFSALGGRLPKGVLLTGPPGTGKTLLARAVAGEAGVPFLFASGSEFDEMYVGVGAKRIRELFAAARKKQPAIIFIDELDAVGGRRSSRDQQYVKQTLNQLLVELDGFNASDGIIVVGATNFPEMLDKALVRPGRFDKQVAVPLPDVRGRVQILRHHMQNILASQDLDLQILARGTSGFSGAELENMVNQAAIYAARKGATSVSLPDLEWAKDKILMGAERTSAYIPEDVKRSTAVHEGGHALVALFTKASMPLHKVTCLPRGHALGLTQRLPQNDRHSVSWIEYMADIDVALGGRVAEEIVYGKENVSSGSSSDLRAASTLANTMVQRWGYSDTVGLAYFDAKDNTMSTNKREQIETEVDRMLRESEGRVRELLVSHRHELDLLTDALVEHETLDLKEVETVIKGEIIREGQPRRPKPTGGLAGLSQPDSVDIPPPPIIPPGAGGRGAPLPHPAPQSSTSASPSSEEGA